MTKINLFDLWLWPLQVAHTAASLAETITNSRAVISARTPMIQAAFLNPFEANTVELTRMVTEKWDAFSRSGKTLSSGQRTVQATVAANARDMGRLAGGHFFGPADWMRMAERNLALWSALTELPGAALKPIQMRAASNASRLNT